MKVSIVMASFNRPHLLDLGLFSLMKQSINYDTEIIVVNDGPNDDTKEVCKKYSDKLNIKYIFSGDRNVDSLISRNPCIPLNIGIKKAEGDVVILTSPEIYHLNDAINEIASPFERNHDYLVIPESMYFDNTREYTNELMAGKIGDLYKCELRADHVLMPFLMGIWKQHLIDIGGYDEDFIGYAGEDNDIIDRLKLKGCEYLKVNAQIVHLYHGKAHTNNPNWEGKSLENNPDWLYNHKLYLDRKGILVRNVGRDWGYYKPIDFWNLDNFNEDVKEIFTQIYKTNLWGSNESVSGAGSELKSTMYLVEQLPPIFKKYKIKRLLDCGCGDFNWMKNIVSNLEFYMGVDVVDELIQNNIEKYSSEEIQFMAEDIRNIDLESYKFDAIIITDVLVHFSYKDIKRFFDLIAKAKIRYVFTTHFRQKEMNRDITTGDWRALNLMKDPFYFPEPLEIVPYNEPYPTETGEIRNDKTLSLWEAATFKMKI